MKHSQRIDSIKKMLSLLDEERSHLGENGHLEVSHYTSETRLNDEIKQLFKNYPIMAGHASQLKDKASFITLDIADTAVLVNRDRDGKLRAFINSCRHRGAKLTNEACGQARAFKCPYHAWSYLDDGSLKFVPQEESFPSLEKKRLGLIQLKVAEHAGFIWVLPETSQENGDQTIDMENYLSGVDNDLVEFGLENHVLRVSDIQHPKCNWKLVIDAFSEGYHLKTLHKNSVEPFFHDNGVVFDQMGLHSRSIGSRKEIDKARTLAEKDWDFRALTTPFYTLFPNTVLVFHPDWVSRITVFPNGPDNCKVYHDMLVPDDADLSSSYWDKTFALINEQVFAAEDIAICENIQKNARSGADTQWITGGLETPVLWFHKACEDAITKKNK